MKPIVPTLTHRVTKLIDQAADQEEPFFLFYSMTSPHEPVVPNEPFRGKSGIAPIADFLMETDWSVGQILKQIDDAELRDDTIVIFTADNGHSHYTGWDELIAAGHAPSGPYRGHKGDIWEGGHRVPLIVRWPGHVPGGETSDRLVCLNDLFATLADLTSQPLPSDAAEDSNSFADTWGVETNVTPRGRLVSHSNRGEFAYREGPWKLVFKLPGQNFQNRVGRRPEKCYSTWTRTSPKPTT